MEDTIVHEDIENSSWQLKGWHVLIIMICFFSVMFTANGIFLYHAITSFPGEDVKKSYVQGLDYNRTIEARRNQEELGWSASAGYIDGQLIFQLKDKDGNYVYGHNVEAEIRRDVTVNDDRTLQLTRTASGDYFANIADLEAGQWSVRFVVRPQESDNIVFKAHKTITVLP